MSLLALVLAGGAAAKQDTKRRGYQQEEMMRAVETMRANDPNATVRFFYDEQDIDALRLKQKLERVYGTSRHTGKVNLDGEVFVMITERGRFDGVNECRREILRLSRELE